MEEPGERLKAFCSITFDDCFVVRDLKIIEGANGPFVAMPSRKLTSHCPKCGMKNHLRAAHCNQCGARLEDGRAPKDADGRAKLYADIAHPINSECREMIQDCVIREYFQEIDRAKQPGYVSRYDDFDFEYAEVPRSKPARVDTPHGTPAPMARKSPAGSAPGHHPSISAAPSSVSRGAEPRPQRRSDAPRDVPRAPASTDTPKGDSFGAGIFPDD
jgi:stage V sporulation protein G